MNYKIIKLTDRPELLDEAARWFNSKWGVPTEAYIDSMTDSLSGSAVPRWYLAMDDERIIGGCGVIKNDFHLRPDLTPNLCALYVEEDCRCHGIAGELMDFVCQDMASCGIKDMFRLTDHTSFYERYGWEFFVMVKNDDGESESRMYKRVTKLKNYIPDIGDGEHTIDVRIRRQPYQVNDRGELECFVVLQDKDKRYYVVSTTYEQSKELDMITEGTLTVKNREAVSLNYSPPSPDDEDYDEYYSLKGCFGAL